MYSPAAMDHFLQPRHCGVLTGADIAVGTATNADCGDTARVTLRVVDGCVAHIAFSSQGCAGAIAACSATCAWLHGRPVGAALGLTGQTIEELLAPWPAAKRGCTQMAVAAAIAALNAAASGR